MALMAATVPRAYAQVPQTLSYQGKIKVNGNDFNGAGQFKFALVNAAGSQSYWSNDGVTVNGTEPVTAVAVPVQAGLYTVLLGDATLPNMAALPAGVFKNGEMRLRVWFNDGTNGWQRMSPDQRVAAVGYALMAETVPDGSLTSAKLADGAVTSSKIAAGAVTATALAPQAVVTSLNEAGFNALPSGTTLISKDSNSASLINAGYTSVGNINAGDSWTAITGGAARDRATAVWTGTEMMVWGDSGGGWRYNPTTNTWKAMNTVNQPAPRNDALAVWTGTEMIVWGGVTDLAYQNTGGRYNPTTDTWSTVGTANAPSARYRASAVWTGNAMIVWGGVDGTAALGDGAAFYPETGIWATISKVSAPSARQLHTAVWSGAEMIVWGGVNTTALSGQTAYADGARYNPATNIWTGMAASNTNPRFFHTAVWTGSEMMVWGGQSKDPAGPTGAEFILFNSGSRYNAAGNTWTAMSVSDAVPARMRHTAVWSGNEMIVWGGYTSPYNPAVYTSTGGRYSPGANSWTAAGLTGVPAARAMQNAVWSGSEMIIWGGTSGSELNTGGRYRPGQTLYLYQRP
ncbi:MAG: Kelch repeat protein [Verrucomicrobiales bacterium]|nr:Kelch repeat protein [Verrucomicrobiales bacterium]